MAHERILRDAHDESDYSPVGESLEPGVAALLRPPEPPREISSLYEDRPTLDSSRVLASFLDLTEFQERHSNMRLRSDLIGLVRKVGDGLETYRHKLDRSEERSGRLESARYGIGTLVGERAVIYALDWSFFAGSLGEVAGEKFVRAAKLAASQDLPLVGFGASSGVRQHENGLGLAQMSRIAAAIADFEGPYISAMAGQVWGGWSASGAPAGLTVALKGTDYGFAGPRVIKAFEGHLPEPGAQSAEANMIRRNIDLVVEDVPEMIELIGGALRTVRRSRSMHAVPEWNRATRVDPHATSRSIHVGAQGIYPALSSNQTPERTIAVERNRADQDAPTQADALMARYREIASSSNRIDTEFIMQNAFDEVYPFYNAIQFEDLKKYPAIIASIATIGEQGFMVIGDQPSYKVSGDYVGKRSANPGPRDYRYAQRMLKYAEQWKLPVVFLTDTLGALPTIEAEQDDQSRAISDMLIAGSTYPYPIVSVITGALGSGGGLATTPFGREVVMLDSSLAFVSEPRSMSSILYPSSEPTEELVRFTLGKSRSSAQDLCELGLVDAVVADDPNPYQTANNIRAAIVDGYEKQRGKSPRRLRSDAEKKLAARAVIIGRQ